MFSVAFTGQVCTNGGCCPTSAMPACPNGVPATVMCVGTGVNVCATNQICINSGCCANTCPDGSVIVQQCFGTGQSNCGGGIIVTIFTFAIFVAIF